MSTRSFRLAYGRAAIEARIDRGFEPGVLSPRFPKPAADYDVIRQSLRSPIESRPLKDLVGYGQKVAIIVSDTTRATASHLILPILVDELNSAGVRDSDIEIVVALGIHRRQTKEEHRALVGDSIFGRIRISDHDAYAADALVEFGQTSRGTPVAVNKTVAMADKVILTGAAVPHYFAGFGGGRKSIMPGVCSQEANLHSHFLVFNSDSGRNPKVETGRLAGNPVHEDMVEAAEMVSPHFIINAVLNDKKEVCAVFAGDMAAAHRQACTYYLENFGVIVDSAADLTIVSCGGYPKDINFIQAHKAIQSAYAITKPGGWMIVLAECGDGFGYPGFIDWFRFKNSSEFEQALRREYHIYGQTAYAAYEKATSVNIILVSRLAPHEVERMQMHSAKSFEEAYALATSNLTRGSALYIIPASSASIFHTETKHRELLDSIMKYKEIHEKV
jgi:nickel-dependent lactate racemase